VSAYDIADVGDLDAEAPGGMVRKVRRAVGAKAFGCDYFSGVDGLEFVTIGAPFDRQYQPPSWG
jgi:hypothetical protein